MGDPSPGRPYGKGPAVSTIQMTLSIVGGMLIPVSMYGLRRKRPPTKESEWKMPRCSTPSPDQSLRCKQELGHLGWHEGGTKSWYGDCWFEGQTAETKRYRDQLPIETRPIEQSRIKKSAIEKSGRSQPRRPLTDGKNSSSRPARTGTGDFGKPRGDSSNMSAGVLPHRNRDVRNRDARNRNRHEPRNPNRRNLNRRHLNRRGRNPRIPTSSGANRSKSGSACSAREEPCRTTETGQAPNRECSEPGGRPG